MTARYIDSCEAYASAADFATSWSQTSGSLTPVTTGGRWGTGYLSSAGMMVASRSFSPGLAEWIVGFVWRANLLTGAQALIRFNEGATLHVDLRWDALGHLLVTRNGTTLATGTTVFLINTDYAIDIRVKISDTVGTLEVWVNDVQELVATGLDTQNGGTGLVDTISLCASNGQTSRFSEVYIFDTAGSVNNVRAGSWRISPRRPSVAGNYAQWTPNASTNVSRVSDSPANDGDTTYNSDATAGHKDSFQFGAVPWTAGTIAGIMHRLVARKDDAGVKTIRAIQRQSGADQSGTTQTLTIAYVHYTEVKETNPSTAVAYTTAEMRTTTPEFGYEVVA